MDKIDRAEVLKYEARVREIDSKVEVEKAARARAEGQSDKFKEQVVTLEQVSLFRFSIFSFPFDLSFPSFIDSGHPLKFPFYT